MLLDEDEEETEEEISFTERNLLLLEQLELLELLELHELEHEQLEQDVELLTLLKLQLEEEMLLLLNGGIEELDED